MISKQTCYLTINQLFTVFTVNGYTVFNSRKISLLVLVLFPHFSSPSTFGGCHASSHQKSLHGYCCAENWKINPPFFSCSVIISQISASGFRSLNSCKLNNNRLSYPAFFSSTFLVAQAHLVAVILPAIKRACMATVVQKIGK